MRLWLCLLVPFGSIPVQAAVVSAGSSAAPRGALPASYPAVSPSIHRPLTAFLASGLPLLAARLHPEAANLLKNLSMSVAQGAPAASVLAPLAWAMRERGLSPMDLSGPISEASANLLSEAALSARQEVELQAVALMAESVRPKNSIEKLSSIARRMAEFGVFYGSYFGAAADKTFASALSDLSIRRTRILTTRMSSAAKSAQAALDGTPMTAETAEKLALPPMGYSTAIMPANKPVQYAKPKTEAPAALVFLPAPLDLPPPSPPIPPAAGTSGRGLWAPETIEAPLADDPLGVTVHRLSNGMTVYLSPNRLEPRVTARVAVRAGSRQDPADSTGMAHYLEHMLFKGTERLGTTDYEKEKPHLERISALYEDLFRERDGRRRRELYARIDAENQKAAAYAVPNELDRLYAVFGFNDINAHTNTEETVYKESFPSNRAETWARIEAERFARPVFRLFQSELEAVYEEDNRAKDNANRVLWSAVRAAAFKGHPYARSVIGLSEHLKNPSLAKMYAFYDAWYRPENMAVILSGDFDRVRMLALLEEHFGRLRPRLSSP